MAQIPKTLVNAYASNLNNLSEATKRAAIAKLAAIQYASLADLRERIIEVLEPFLAVATNSAAAYAADFYDSARRVTIGASYGALVLNNRKSEDTRKGVGAILSSFDWQKGLDSIISQLENRTDYEIKRAAGECVVGNAYSDSRCMRYARVPTGAETCAFCIMLASQGFVYLSADTAEFTSEGGHYHANCDCMVVPGFGENPQVEGYDKDIYLNQYYKAERAASKALEDEIYTSEEKTKLTLKILRKSINSDKTL